MRVYTRTCDSITGYIQSIKDGNPNPDILEQNYGGHLSWFEIIELGGLNFRFTHSITSTVNKRLKTKRFTFKYVNSEVIFTNNKMTRFTMTFSNTLRKLDSILIRIPNLEDYTTNSIFSRLLLASLEETDHLDEKNNPYDNFDELDVFVQNRIKPNKIRNLLKNNGVKITKDTTHEEFCTLMDSILETYVKSYYDNIKIPSDKLEVIKSEGWEIMGLDQINEIIELFYITSFGGNQIFFKNGNECCGVLNKEELPLLITRAGSFSKDTDSIFELLVAVGSAGKYLSDRYLQKEVNPAFYGTINL